MNDRLGSLRHDIISIDSRLFGITNLNQFQWNISTQIEHQRRKNAIYQEHDENKQWRRKWTEILIFEDLHAPSSKPELWLPHDERASANLRRKLPARPWIVSCSVENHQTGSGRL